MTEPWWSIAVDLILPTFAILVPTGIAIWLARKEREASEKHHAAVEERERSAEVLRGVMAAREMMNYLVEAAYQDNFREASRIRHLAARAHDSIHHQIGGENAAVLHWINAEAKIVTRGLEKTDHLGLPVEAEKIVHRGARFQAELAEWTMGMKSLEWFETAEHLPLEDTPPIGENE